MSKKKKDEFILDDTDLFKRMNKYSKENEKNIKEILDKLK